MDEQQQEQQQFFDYWTYLKNVSYPSTTPHELDK